MLLLASNGVGKTTSIGKLAHKYKQEGKKLRLVAADTFSVRSCSAQLAEWGVVCWCASSDWSEKRWSSFSGLFDGMERPCWGSWRPYRIDTAGRLQNKDNLYGRAWKDLAVFIKRVVPEAPHETLLPDAQQVKMPLGQAKDKITPYRSLSWLSWMKSQGQGGSHSVKRLDIPVRLIVLKIEILVSSIQKNSCKVSDWFGRYI